MKIRRVLILGGSGFIGGWLKQDLAGRGMAVIAPDSCQCDVSLPGAVTEALGGRGKETVVIMAAAVTRSREEGRAALEKNIAMAEHLAREAAAEEVAGLVFLSSVDVYGRPPARLPVNEAGLPAPDTYYGMAKFVSEMLLQKYLNGRCPLAVWRLPGVFGAGDGLKSTLGQLVSRALESGEIHIHGRGEQRRDYLAVQELGQALAHWMKDPKSGTVNLVSGQALSLNELGRLISDALPGIRLVHQPATGSADFDLVFDDTLTKSLFPPMADIHRRLGDYINVVKTDLNQGRTV